MRQLTNEEVQEVDGGMLYEIAYAIGHIFGDAAQSYAKGVERGALPLMYMP